MSKKLASAAGCAVVVLMTAAGHPFAQQGEAPWQASWAAFVAVPPRARARVSLSLSSIRGKDSHVGGRHGGGFLPAYDCPDGHESQWC